MRENDPSRRFETNYACISTIERGERKEGNRKNKQPRGESKHKIEKKVLTDQQKRKQSRKMDEKIEREREIEREHICSSVITNNQHQDTHNEPSWDKTTKAPDNSKYQTASSLVNLYRLRSLWSIPLSFYCSLYSFTHLYDSFYVCLFTVFCLVFLYPSICLYSVYPFIYMFV